MVAVFSTSTLLTADRSHLLAAMATFAGKPPGQWLQPNHPAITGQFNGGWKTAKKFSNLQLIQLVAASAPNHCIDGWSYASRSISALLAGDVHACRHLAYYAQLRAALCILANLGVGVFNATNFVIDASGSITRLDPVQSGNADGLGIGTHKVVWLALREWASAATTANTFLDLVTVGGTKLKDCLSLIWPSIQAVPVASALIEAWGLDLKRGNEEHVFRNISSYAPQALNPIPSTAEESLKFVGNAWRLFEPSSGASFGQLDRYLLRSLLWRQHKLVYNNSRYKNGAISQRYDELPASIKFIASKNFLLGVEEPHEPPLLAHARKNSSNAKPTEMLARALLLLRASTAFTHSSFIQAGVNVAGGELRPWIDQWAETRGFWPPSSPLPDPIDLWADVELALIDLANSCNPAPPNLNAWLQRNDKGLPVLCEAERVGVWSLCA